MTSAAATDLAARVAALVRDVPDFPVTGVMFKDLTPLFVDGAAFRAVTDAIVAAHLLFDVVAGIEARGFLLAAAVGYASGAGVVPIRKPGKLPGATVGIDYQLEYGEARLELHRDAVRPGQRVLIVDDVLATGGTLGAAFDLIGQLRAEVVGVSVLLEIAALRGRQAVAFDVHAVLSV